MNFLSRNALPQSIVRFLRINKFNKRSVHDASTISSSTLHSTSFIRPFSIAVSHDVYHSSDFNDSMATVGETHGVRLLGTELHPKDALYMSKDFDKIVIFLSHGEVAPNDENDDKITSPNNLSLTGRGFGQAMSASGETARYFSSRSLVPQLFVVAPQRYAIESALIAFPTFSPNSIHGQKWVVNQNCSDVKSGLSDIQHLKKSFPGISFDNNMSSDSINMHSYLSSCDEKVVVVASTPSWIENFLSDFETTFREKSKPNYLRVLGIKYF